MAIHAPTLQFDYGRPVTLAERATIEAEIERLICLLDLVDGDCDLEDDDPAGDHVDEFGEETPITVTFAEAAASAPPADGFEKFAAL